MEMWNVAFGFCYCFVLRCCNVDVLTLITFHLKSPHAFERSVIFKNKINQFMYMSLTIRLHSISNICYFKNLCFTLNIKVNKKVRIENFLLIYYNFCRKCRNIKHLFIVETITNKLRHFNYESAHNRLNWCVNVTAIVEKLCFWRFEWCKRYVLNGQRVFFEDSDYWLWFQFIRIQSNVST